MARPKRRSSSSSKSNRAPAAAALALLAAAPLLVGGAVAVSTALSAATSPLGAWLKSILGASPSRTAAIRDALMGYARGHGSFAALRGAILGSAKGSVVTVFGPPRTALLGRNAGKLSIWRADTWYYPLDRADRSALAIRFVGNVAQDVERISVPTAMIE